MNDYQGISLMIHWFSEKSFDLGSICSIIKYDQTCMIHIFYMYIVIQYVYIYIIIYTYLHKHTCDIYFGPISFHRKIPWHLHSPRKNGRWKNSWPRCWSAPQAPGSRSSPDSPVARRWKFVVQQGGTLYWCGLYVLSDRSIWLGLL